VNPHGFFTSYLDVKRISHPTRPCFFHPLLRELPLSHFSFTLPLKNILIVSLPKISLPPYLLRFRNTVARTHILSRTSFHQIPNSYVPPSVDGVWPKRYRALESNNMNFHIGSRSAGPPPPNLQTLSIVSTRNFSFFSAAFFYNLNISPFPTSPFRLSHLRQKTFDLNPRIAVISSQVLCLDYFF